MLSLKHKLVIGGKTFPGVKRVKIDSNRRSISDTAEIELPEYKNLKRSDIEGADARFDAGYSLCGLFSEFEGFIREVSEKQPYILYCEDYFYKLRGTVNKTFKNIYSGDIIKQFCSGTGIDTSKVQNGVKLKEKSYSNKTVRWIIQDLAFRSGFDCYMRGKKIIFDKPFIDADTGDTGVFEYGRNIIEDNLNVSDGIFDKVIVLSENMDGSGEIFQGKAGSGKRIKTHYIDNLSKEEAINRAKEYLEFYNYKGFIGDILTFGYPPVFHSRKIHIKDKRFPDKTGIYYADRVEKDYGGGGFRQRIYLYYGEKKAQWSEKNKTA